MPEYSRENAFYDFRRLFRKPNNIIVFLSTLAVGFLAKGGVILPGYAIDDIPYSFAFSHIGGGVQEIINGGRFIAAGILYLLDFIGVRVSDTYLSFGLVSLILQAAFVVSMLRFVGVANLPSASLIGALIVAHPYSTEILTFRVSLPFYCAALLFSIISLEMILRRPDGTRERALAFLSTLAMLFTYQSFLNYFAVAIVFCLMAGMLTEFRFADVKLGMPFRRRAMALIGVSVLSTVTFVVITKIVAYFKLMAPSNRSKFVALDGVSERLGQIRMALTDIYWTDQPIMPGSVKVVILCVILITFVSVLLIFNNRDQSENKQNSRNVFILCIISLVPISVGLIIPFQGWWPVPRVLAHVSAIIGLSFILLDLSFPRLADGYVGKFILLIRVVLVVVFILICNQIFADQVRINRLDSAAVNRIVMRLETESGFANVRYVHISGGHWGYASGLKTVMGDMNISALMPDYSKIHLLNLFTGYGFEKAIGSVRDQGIVYCNGRPVWPHKDSIAVVGELAIVCLKEAH